MIELNLLKDTRRIPEVSFDPETTGYIIKKMSTWETFWRSDFVASDVQLQEQLLSEKRKIEFELKSKRSVMIVVNRNQEEAQSGELVACKLYPKSDDVMVKMIAEGKMEIGWGFVKKATVDRSLAVATVSLMNDPKHIKIHSRNDALVTKFKTAEAVQAHTGQVLFAPGIAAYAPRADKPTAH